MKKMKPNSKKKKDSLYCISYRGCTNNCWRLGIVGNGV